MFNWADKVQKLLTKAEDDASTQDEKNECLRLATEIMAKYGIDKAMVDFAKPAAKQVIIDIIKDFENPYASSKEYLYSAIAKAFSCSPISIGHREWKDGKRVNVSRVRLFGYTSDVETVEEIYTMLLLHGVNALNKEEIWGNAKSFRVSWWLGYSIEIGERLEAANKKVVNETPGSALVLRDRSLATRGAMRAEYPVISTKSYSYGDGGGFNAGKAEGRRVGLGGAKVANSGRAALH